MNYLKKLENFLKDFKFQQLLRTEFYEEEKFFIDRHLTSHEEIFDGVIIDVTMEFHLMP